MRVSRQAVSQAAEALQAAGLLYVARGEIRLLAPRLELHDHPPADPCSEQCVKPAHLECNVTEQRRGLAADLREAVKVYTDDGRSRRRAPPPVPDQGLADAYTALRRRVDPLYKPTPKTAAALVSCERALRVARVARRYWPDYLTWVFEEFHRMTGGKLCFAPVDRLSSEALIDRFSATLPAQKLNAKKARELLKARGYTGSVPAALEIAQAVHEGREPRSYSEAAQEAGRWLAERLDEIGTVEVGS